MSIKRESGRLMPTANLIYFSSSGKPLIESSSDTKPESIEADSTSRQSTCEITADVPIVAIAVSATVLIARTPAALSHFKNF